jgi:hypothetical protein
MSRTAGILILAACLGAGALVLGGCGKAEPKSYKDVRKEGAGRADRWRGPSSGAAAKPSQPEAEAAADDKAAEELRKKYIDQERARDWTYQNQQSHEEPGDADNSE